MNVLRRVIVGAITAAVLLVTPGLAGVAAADGSSNGGHSCHDGGRDNGTVNPDNTCPNNA